MRPEENSEKGIAFFFWWCILELSKPEEDTAMAYNELYTEGIPVISGSIETTGERCKMQSNGYWVGAGGRHITSYIRVDKDEPAGIERQYSMDKHHRFWIETEDKAY